MQSKTEDGKSEGRRNCTTTPLVEPHREVAFAGPGHLLGTSALNECPTTDCELLTKEGPPWRAVPPHAKHDLLFAVLGDECSIVARQGRADKSGTEIHVA